MFYLSGSNAVFADSVLQESRIKKPHIAYNS